MPFVTPPTFVDGQIMSAADLNKLSDNQEFLYGHVSGINPGFNAIRTVNSLTSANNAFVFRYNSFVPFFHYRVQLHTGALEALRVYIDGTGYDIATGASIGPGLWDDCIDLSGAGFNENQIITTYIKADEDGSMDFSLWLLELQSVNC